MQRGKKKKEKPRIREGKCLVQGLRELRLQNLHQTSKGRIRWKMAQNSPDPSHLDALMLAWGLSHKLTNFVWPLQSQDRLCTFAH